MYFLFFFRYEKQEFEKSLQEEETGYEWLESSEEESDEPKYDESEYEYEGSEEEDTYEVSDGTFSGIFSDFVYRTPKLFSTILSNENQSVRKIFKFDKVYKSRYVHFKNISGLSVIV